MNGGVTKRKKRLSKATYGTSHIMSLDEAGHVFQKGSGRLIVGSGQSGLARLSEDAAGYFQCQACNAICCRQAKRSKHGIRPRER